MLIIVANVISDILFRTVRVKSRVVKGSTVVLESWAVVILVIAQAVQGILWQVVMPMVSARCRNPAVG